MKDSDLEFKSRRLDNNEWVTGWFTNKKIGSLIVPVIEVFKEWDSGDYIETYEIDGDTLTHKVKDETKSRSLC